MAEDGGVSAWREEEGFGGVPISKSDYRMSRVPGQADLGSPAAPGPAQGTLEEPGSSEGAPCPPAVSGRSGDATWLARGSTINFAGGLAGRGLQVGCNVAVARLLGPVLFGMYSIGWTMLRVGGIVTPLGLDLGVIHCATRYAATDSARLRKVLVQSLAFAVLTGAVAGLGLCLGARALAHHVFKKDGLTPLIYAFALGFPLVAALRVASASTRVSQRMQYSVYSEVITQPAVNLALIVAFYLIGWRLLGMVAAAVASCAIALALALYYEARLFPQLRWPARGPRSVTRELLGFSLASWGGTVSISLIPWVDRLFVGAFLAPAEVGAYQAAAQATVLFAMIAGAFNGAVAPRISMLCHSPDPRRLNDLYGVAAKWALYANIPFFLVFCSSPRALLALVYGADYAGGATPLVILAAAHLIDAAVGGMGALLLFSGRRGLFFLISGSALILAAALNYLLVPRFGVVGAALAMGCTNTIMTLALLIAGRSALGIFPFDQRWLKGIAAAAAALGALLLARPAELQIRFLGLALAFCLSAGVFLGALAVLGLDPEDRDLIRVIRLRLWPE